MNTHVLLGLALVLGLVTASGAPVPPEDAPATMTTWLTGVVTDEATGRPLPGVVVRVEVNGWPRDWAETDDAGRYTFDDWAALQPRTASGAMAIIDGLVVAVRAMHPRHGSSARWLEPLCGSFLEVVSSDCPQISAFVCVGSTLWSRGVRPPARWRDG